MVQLHVFTVFFRYGRWSVAIFPRLTLLVKPTASRARSALEETARHLGVGLSIIVTTLSPSLICVGGEIAEAWDLVEPILRETIAARALTDNAALTPVIRELASSKARLRGATVLVAAPLFAAPSIA